MWIVALLVGALHLLNAVDFIRLATCKHEISKIIVIVGLFGAGIYVYDAAMNI